MNEMIDFLSHIPGMPMEYVFALIVFAVIGLSAFALYVVLCAVKGRQQ